MNLYSDYAKGIKHQPRSQGFSPLRRGWADARVFSRPFSPWRRKALGTRLYLEDKHFVNVIRTIEMFSGNKVTIADELSSARFAKRHDPEKITNFKQFPAAMEQCQVN